VVPGRLSYAEINTIVWSVARTEEDTTMQNHLMVLVVIAISIANAWESVTSRFPWLEMPGLAHGAAVGLTLGVAILLQWLLYGAVGQLKATMCAQTVATSSSFIASSRGGGRRPVAGGPRW
jgi:hypothetical protein